MKWNDHSNLEGLHAFLGASNYHWINWSDDIFEQRYYAKFAQDIGTLIHELAKELIRKRRKLHKHDKLIIENRLDQHNIPLNAYDANLILSNLIPFVNDAIGFHMESEKILYFSPSCFGTTDAIYYNEKDRMLRIHDLKTGSTTAHMEQLLLYSALFCLEYHVDPTKITTELRIYQNSEVVVYNPEGEEIQKFMDLIIYRNNTINTFRGMEIEL